MKYRIVVHKSRYRFNVYCPILPGCNSQGDTLEEALENIKDAIATYLDMVKKETKKLETYDVEVSV
ncbi:MAG TPA: type II toxin-antitoxin system HicB family antitoxin [Candidatus Brocadiia bacterium]